MTNTMTNLEALRRLWDRMAAIYGHAWTSAYGLAPAGACADEWALAIGSMDRAQATRAIERCRISGDRFPPTPSLFREWGLGIPSFEAVRAELLSRDSSQLSPFAVAVARRMDLWAWRHADADRADRMLREAYAATRDALMRGEPLPERALEIAAPVEAPRISTPEVGRAALASIDAMLGEARPTDPTPTLPRPR